MCGADGFYIWCGLQQGMFEEIPPPSNRLEMTAAFTQTLKANSLSYWEKKRKKVISTRVNTP